MYRVQHHLKWLKMKCRSSELQGLSCRNNIVTACCSSAGRTACVCPVFGGGGGCYLHVVPLVTSFRRLNTPSTCLPWVASRIGGRRDPGGWGRRSLRTLYSQHTTLALISLRRVIWWARPDQSAGLVDLVFILVYYLSFRLISSSKTYVYR